MSLGVLSSPLRALIAFGLIAASALTSQAQQPSLLTRHVREVTLNGQAPLVGRLPATQSMRLVLVLPHRNEAELTALLKELYDPSSASYTNSSRWKSSPQGSVQARKIMTRRFASRKRTV